MPSCAASTVTEPGAENTPQLWLNFDSPVGGLTQLPGLAVGDANDSSTKRHGHGACPVIHFKLCEDVFNVALGRLLADPQASGKFLVPHPLSHQLQNLNFPRCEAGLGQAIGQLAGDVSGDGPAASVHLTDNRHQVVAQGLLEQVRDRASLKGSENLLVALVCGKNDYAGVWNLAPHQLDGF